MLLLAVFTLQVHLYSRSMLLEGRLGGSSPDSPSSYCPATDHVHYYYCMSNEAVANYLRKSRVATYLFFRTILYVI